jgi:hypothetical protein
MKSRRSTASSALSFMDCICCAFGAVLLLFILTAKKHHQDQFEIQKISQSTLAELQTSLQDTQKKLDAVEQALAKAPIESVQFKDLKQANAEKAHTEQAIQAAQAQLEALHQQQALETNSHTAEWKKVPSAPRYLADLQLTGPKIALILESSGSMLGEDVASVLTQRQQSPNNSNKWQRAKSIVRTLIASIPPKHQFALLSMQAETTLVQAPAADAYLDSDNGEAIANILQMLDKIEPRGGANLSAAMRAIQQLSPRPTSVLLITDGLPTAPSSTQSKLSESDRVQLFLAAAQLCPDLTFNVLLLPFAGDPSAAGLYWQLCSQKKGLCLVPASDWPSQTKLKTR